MFLFLRIFLICFLSAAGVFANDSISVDLSSENISLGEIVTLEVRLSLSESAGDKIALEVPGIEAFQIFSQSRSYNYQNINGETQGFLQYNLDLSPLSSGDFNLGPIKILSGSGAVSGDEILSITVTELGNVNSEVQSENTPEINLKGDRKNIFPWILTISIALFFASLIYLFFSKNKQAEELPQQIEDIQSQENMLKEYFNKLGKENKNLSSQSFFKKYNTGLRQVLQNQGINNAHKITLTELGKNKHIQNNGVYNIFKKSYKYEYSETSISRETRKKYIDDILGLMSK